MCCLDSGEYFIELYFTFHEFAINSDSHEYNLITAWDTCTKKDMAVTIGVNLAKLGVQAPPTFVQIYFLNIL